MLLSHVSYRVVLDVQWSMPRVSFSMPSIRVSRGETVPHLSSKHRARRQAAGGDSVERWSAFGPWFGPGLPAPNAPSFFLWGPRGLHGPCVTYTRQRV